MEFPTEKYSVIYCDPPWKYEVESTFAAGGNRLTGGASTHYQTMSLEDLKKIPVKSIAEKKCLLFMWCSSPQLETALRLGAAWGFQYKTTAFVWNKMGSMVGHYTMSSCEYVLVFKRGGIPTPRGSKNERQYYEEKKSKRHSEKPSAIRNKIANMFPTQKKIELFARHKVDGWDSWGNDPVLTTHECIEDSRSKETNGVLFEISNLTTDEQVGLLYSHKYS